MSIRAMVMPGPDQPLEMRELPEPEIENGGAMLKTSFSEVCGTDVHLWKGRLAGVPYPIVPGHVSVGVLNKIRGVLKDVDEVPFHEGDEAAFLDVWGSCGSCAFCLVYKATTRCPDRKVYGITFSANEERGPLGGWADEIYMKPGTKLLRLPKGLDAKAYIGGGCGLNTAMHAVDRADIKLNDNVAVLGVGPVGQSVIAFSSLSGASKVLAVGAPDDRLAYARRMGATNTCGLDMPAAERAAWVRDQTKGRGADVVIEAAGDPRAVKQALEMVRDNGRVVVVGQYTDNGSVEINPHVLINRKHVEIRASWGSDFSHFYRAIAVMADHQEEKPWREMAENQFPLDQCEIALKAIEARRMVKAVICPGIGQL